jgi:hypothetical protein
MVAKLTDQSNWQDRQKGAERNKEIKHEIVK